MASRFTKGLMTLGSFEQSFRKFPHLLDDFIVGRHVIYEYGVHRMFAGVVTDLEREDDMITVKGPGPQFWLGETEMIGNVRPPRVYDDLRTDQIVDNLLWREESQTFFFNNDATKYIQVNDHDVLSPHSETTTSEMTVEIKFKLISLGADRYLMAKTAAGQWEYAFWVASNNTLRYTLYQAGGAVYGSVAGATVLEANKWYHGAVSIIKGTAMTLYLGDIAEGTIAEDGVNTSFVGATVNGTAPLLIGKRHDGVQMNGYIRDVRIWRKARSEDEIAGSAIGIGGNESHLVNLWRIDEGAGTLVRDRGPYKRNATAVNPNWVTDGARRLLNPGIMQQGNVIGSFTIRYETSLSAIRRIAWATETEYRVNSDFTFDWSGNGPSLFKTVDTVWAVEAGTVDGEVSYDPSAFKAVSRVYAIGAGEGDNLLVRVGKVDLPTAWKDWQNKPFERDMVIDAPNADTEQEVNLIALGQATLHAKEVQHARFSISQEEFLLELEPGDTTYVYRDFIVEDQANEIPYMGRIYPALQMRVRDITYSPGPGWRVLLRQPDGTEDDVTEYAEFNPVTRAEVHCSNRVDIFEEIRSPEGLIIDDRTHPQPGSPDDGDTTVPAAPAGLTVTTQNYKDWEGRTRAKLNFTWTATTLNTDGTPISDLSGYVVRYRRVAGDPDANWQTEEVHAPDTAVTVEDLSSGVAWEAQVASRDTNTHQSEWAPVAPVNTTSSKDTTPPPQPKAPRVTGGIRRIFVDWDAKDSSTSPDPEGQPMPADLRWYEVHASGTSGFTPTSATLKREVQGTLADFEVAAGGTWYVKLIAIDLAGNVSAASAQSSGVASDQITGDDIEDDAISGQHIAAGAIDPEAMVLGNFDNYIQDPGFEQLHGDNYDQSGASATNWGFPNDPTNARTGGWVANHIGSPTGSKTLTAKPKVECRTGDEFFAEVFAKSTADANGTLVLEIQWYDRNEAALSISTLETVNGPATGYTVLAGKAQAPLAAVYGRVQVKATHTAGTWYVDDFYYKKVQIAAYIADLAVITLLAADLVAGTGRIDNLTVFAGQFDTAAIRRADIMDLEVTNAKIESVVANKLTAGDIVATLTVTSGLIRTALSGPRVELRSAGLLVKDNTDATTISLASAGLELFTTTTEKTWDAVRWWRQGAGDASAYLEVRGRRSSNLSGAFVLKDKSGTNDGQLQVKYTRSTGDETSRLLLNDQLAILELSLGGTNQSRLTLNPTDAILDSDSGGTTQGRMRVFKADQSSLKDARVDIRGLLHLSSAGLVYPNAFTISSGSTKIKSGGKHSVAKNYTTAFPTGQTPYVLGTANDSGAASVIAHATRTSNAACVASLVNMAPKAKTVAGVFVPLLT